MITSKIIIFLFYLYVQLNAFPKFQPISSVNLRPTTTWIPGPNDNKYQFHNGWQTWLSAREYCLSQNSDLVSINSDEELNWILKHYPNDITGVEERHVQIGLFIPASENNNWTWTDKSIVNYTLSPFNNMNFLNNDKKCGVYLINKKTFESVSCDIPINPTDKPIRFICERSNENHMALEKANNPLWEKFDKILQFLGISDVSSTGENLKKKEEKKKDDYYDDDNEFDSREFDKIKKKDTKDKTIIVTIVDSQDSNNTKISKEIKEEINNEGSGDEVTNDFDSIATRKNIALSTPIMKDNKIDIPIDDGNMKLVQMQKIDGVLDNRIIGDNLISKTPKLSTIDDFKYHDIEGSGEDIIKVNNQKNDGALSLNSINSDQGKHAIIKNNKIEGGNITNNISSTGHIDEVTPINNVEIENVEKKIVKFFKVLYQYLKKTDVKSLKEIIDSREPGVSIMDHLKNSLNAANQREVDQIKALEKLYQMGVNLEKVRHDSINKTLEHNAVKTAIKDIEKELTDELTKNMSEEFDEANNLVNNQSNYLENPNIKKIIIYKNETTTQKENLITTRKIIVSTKNSLSKNSSTATKSSLLNKKRKKVKKNKKINKNKNKKNNAKKMPKIIDEWHPEIPPTEEQKKEFLALEKGRAKLNDDTYEIFRNFNENERTKKLLNRIHQHEMEKKKSSEKELLTKSIKNKSQETSQNDFNGLLNLVTKTDKTVNNFIDKHK